MSVIKVTTSTGSVFGYGAELAFADTASAQWTMVSTSVSTTLRLTGAGGAGFVGGSGAADHVAFWSSATTITYDSAKFKYFSATGNMTIGYSADNGYKLNIYGNGAVIQRSDDTPANEPTWVCYRSRGSNAAPTVLSAGDALGTYLWYGATAAATFSAAGEIRLLAASGWGAGSSPADMYFRTTPTGTTAVVTRYVISSAVDNTWTQGVRTSGSPTGWTYTGAAHTTLAAGTEAIDVYVNMARTVGWNTSGPTTQRSVVFAAPTYTISTIDAVIDAAATVAITGAPVASGISITRPAALWIQTGNVILGTISSSTSLLRFAHASSAHLTSLQAGNATAAVTYTLPTAAPTSDGQALLSTTGGVTSWGSAGVGLGLVFALSRVWYPN